MFQMNNLSNTVLQKRTRNRQVNDNDLDHSSVSNKTIFKTHGEIITSSLITGSPNLFSCASDHIGTWRSYLSIPSFSKITGHLTTIFSSGLFSFLTRNSSLACL